MTDLKVVDMDKMLTIAEKFGPTLQGEGPSMGRPAMFLRLGLCNLDCSWCDTPFTWDWTGKNGVAYDKDTELERVPVSTLVDWFKTNTMNPPRIVITGGEPLVQKAGVVNLVMRLLDAVPSCAIEIETNGTIAPPIEILESVQWNVSPKLHSSGVELSKRYNGDAIDLLAKTSSHGFKFVMSNIGPDLAEVRMLMEAHGINGANVYLMPEGRSPGEVNARLPELFDIATSIGVNVTTRLHVLAFGDKRGV